ncbi:hypothetical protein MLD52_17845 [Puniceicoccaceae bacterium K14]|nr:hypothetical protein [Puniceicoccaceae bacterium K14]
MKNSIKICGFVLVLGLIVISISNFSDSDQMESKPPEAQFDEPENDAELANKREGNLDSSIDSVGKVVLGRQVLKPSDIPEPGPTNTPEQTALIKMVYRGIGSDLSITPEFAESIGISDIEREKVERVLKEERRYIQAHQKSNAVLMRENLNEVYYYIPSKEGSSFDASVASVVSKLESVLGEESTSNLWALQGKKIRDELGFFNVRDQEVSVYVQGQSYMVKESYTAENGDLREVAKSMTRVEIIDRYKHIDGFEAQLDEVL